jgi:hypothetical protein
LQLVENGGVVAIQIHQTAPEVESANNSPWN